MLNMMNSLVKLGLEVLDCERVSIFMLEKSDVISEYRLRCVAGEIEGEVIPAGRGIVGAVVRDNCVMIERNIISHPHHYSIFDGRNDFVPRDTITLPILDMCGNPFGAVQVRYDQLDFHT